VGVLKACQPRKDLLSGSINLEIFTASLSQVANHYKGQGTGHPIYTDAKTFFAEGTHFTENMQMVLRDVVSRLKGDTTASALKRLETGFGGGKTHTLIACLHLAMKGKELAPYVSAFIAAENLPEPGTVDVVAIAGDAVPVKEARKTELKPYPLWTEIARQLGGAELCKEVAEYTERLDSPDEAFFDRIFAGRKVLILIDELAHYAARWTVAYPTAKTMLSTFFMSLLGYASQHPGIAIVVTLAGLQDAFSVQTAELSKTLSDITGHSVDAGQALTIQQDAAGELSTVLARSETVVVPVKAKDLSAVLGKRLFEHIDREEARRTVEDYRHLYGRNASLLPGSLQLEPFFEEMLATYPFHPTMLDLLNNRLSTVPTFQKTRGVLRILALAVRALWNGKTDVPMIHACHLDFMDSRTVDELLGRTDNSSMIPVLNADIGTSDSSGLQGGRSDPAPENWSIN
jgi:predicted AAA+ superfamily ATPase